MPRHITDCMSCFSITKINNNDIKQYKNCLKNKYDYKCYSINSLEYIDLDLF